MAAKNTVNIQKMRSAASELDNIYASMQKNIKTLEETMNSVKRVWSGDAAATYLKQYDKNHDSFRKMAAAIKSASQALGESCNTYGQADNRAMDIVEKMAYKVSYKVVSEQGEQLKNIAKDMDNYVNQINQIVSKLGNDELLQSVRADLNKFKKQMEEEKTVLNFAGQVLVDVVQSYTSSEKKIVQKVDRVKAHNRDFYKRPVAVASAGAASGATATATATAHATVNSSGGTTIYQETTNVYVSGGTAGAAVPDIETPIPEAASYVAADIAGVSAGTEAASAGVSAAAMAGVGIVSGMAAAAGGIIGSATGKTISDKMKDKETKK